MDYSPQQPHTQITITFPDTSNYPQPTPSSTYNMSNDYPSVQSTQYMGYPSLPPQGPSQSSGYSSFQHQPTPSQSGYPTLSTLPTQHPNPNWSDITPHSSSSPDWSDIKSQQQYHNTQPSYIGYPALVPQEPRLKGNHAIQLSQEFVQDTIMGAGMGLLFYIGAYFLRRGAISSAKQAHFIAQMPIFSVNQIAQLLTTSTLSNNPLFNRRGADTTVSCIVEGYSACEYEDIAVTSDGKEHGIMVEKRDNEVYETLRCVNKNKAEEARYTTERTEENISNKIYGAGAMRVIDVSENAYLDTYLKQLKRVNNPVFDKVGVSVSQKNQKNKQKEKEKKEREKAKEKEKILKAQSAAQQPSAPSHLLIDDQGSKRLDDGESPPSYHEVSGDFSKKDIDDLIDEQLITPSEASSVTTTTTTQYNKNGDSDDDSDSDDDDDGFRLPNFPSPYLSLPRSMLPHELFRLHEKTLNIASTYNHNTVITNNNINNTTNIGTQVNNNSTNYNNIGTQVNNNNNNTPSQQYGGYHNNQPYDNTQYLSGVNTNQNNNNGQHGQNNGQNNGQNGQIYKQTLHPDTDRPKLIGTSHEEYYLPLRRHISIVGDIYYDGSGELKVREMMNQEEKYKPIIVADSSKSDIVQDLEGSSIILHYSSIALTIIGSIMVLAPPLMHLFGGKK